MNQSERGRISGAARRVKRARNKLLHAQEELRAQQAVVALRYEEVREAMAEHARLQAAVRADGSEDDWSRRD